MKARHAFIGILALGIGFASLAEAQRGSRRGGNRNAKARTGEQTEQFQGRGQRGPGEGAFADLELTAEQTEAIQALRETQLAAREANRETGERPTQEEMETVREAHRAAMAEILTDAQLEQLEEFRANRPERSEGQGDQGRRGGGRGQRGDRPERGEGAFAELELTAEQTEAIQALRETQLAAREENREAGERPTREEMEAVREAHRAAIAEILTEEQLAQLEELRANRPNRNAPVEEETEITPAAKPVGAAIESSSWGSIKSQVR